MKKLTYIIMCAAAAIFFSCSVSVPRAMGAYTAAKGSIEKEDVKKNAAAAATAAPQTPPAKTETAVPPDLRSKQPTAAAAYSPVENTSGVLFKWQIFASNRLIPLNSTADFKSLSGCGYYELGGAVKYAYTYGESADYDAIKSIEKNVKQYFPQAMIVAVKNGKRVGFNITSREIAQKIIEENR